jgi:two-component sensor histidine kinase
MAKALAFLPTRSPMVGKVLAFDWTATPLGAPSAWAPELISAACTVLESKFPMALLWGPEFTTIYNDAFVPILGDKGDQLGQPFSVTWSEVWKDIAPLVKRAYRGEATFIENYPLTLDRFGYPERTWFTFCYSPVRMGDGTVAGMLDTVMETTPMMTAQLRSDILNKELLHRLKNTMSLVQSIAMQSLKMVPERAPVETFLRRILALSNAHDVLQDQNWESGTIRQVVTRMLSLHGGLDHFRLEGEDVRIDSRATLSLSLILHELATNAAKYGALSVPDGRVDIGWRVEGAAGELMLRLWWRERGGPPAAPPTRRGFGSRLVGMGLAGAGTVERHYRPEGFEAAFHAPLKMLQTGD